MTRRLNIFLLILLMAIGLPYYWYLIDGSTGAEQPHPLDLDDLRLLAGSMAGSPPIEVHSETVGLREISGNFLVAGDGLRTVPTAIRVYEVVYENGPPVVIDAGTSRAMAIRHDLNSFDAKAQQRVRKAIAGARMTVLLTDKALHNGGFRPGTSPVGRKVPAPDTGQRSGDDQDTPDDAKSAAPLAPHAIAPGIVAIPLAGLRENARMIYVRLASGAEYLFTGEAAKVARSWRERTLPARFVTRFEHEGYRENAAGWLTAINALHDTAPQMAIVTGHDRSPPALTTEHFSD